LPVVFAVDHAGAVGGDGETHQGIYDIALLSHIPNMTILAPSDGVQLVQMLDFALACEGPVAVRYPKAVALAGDENCAHLLQEGKKIAIVSVGSMLKTARVVADKLQAALFNVNIIKPHDPELINKLADYKYVFTIEDGVKIGGFGQSLARAASEELHNAPSFHAFAFPDNFPETGTRKELFARYNLDAESIYTKIKEIYNGEQ
jgi:1-deoxy-D-xylulose-5-phosphate synthase